jgi:hypothetical protein
MADQFSIGGVPLDPKRVTKPVLREMYKSIKNAEPGQGKEEALAAIEQLGKTGEIPLETYEKVNSFRKEVFTEFKSDKDRMWNTWKSNGKNWKDPVITQARQEMGVGGAFLIADQRLQTVFRESTALSAVQALAGGSFGPAGLVAGYAAYANDREWNKEAEIKTQALVETYKAYQAGDSPMITKGNSVKQVHREELWPALTGLVKEATQAAKDGVKGHAITYQSYEVTSPEVVGELANAGKAGVPIRMNMDIGRLSYPSKDQDGNQYFDVDDIPHKARTGLQLMAVEGADIAVSYFPANRELGDPENLMHRKVMRSGDKVLMSGMNANSGSGENIDAGYIIEGPAAAKYTANVRRDIATSSGAGIEDIWGAEHFEKFTSADLRMGNRGVTALLDSLGGPSPAGQDLPKTKTLGDLEALAAKAGVDLKTMFEIPAADYERIMGGIAAGEGKVSLSAEGKEKLKELLGKTLAATQTEKNIKALADIDLPSDKAVGETRVDIADVPAEREVLILNAVHEAEEFIYLPGFVVTRAVAGAIVAKKREMEAAGKKLDIKIIADSGIYPDGGSPNSWGVNFFEDNGIDVKWSKLTRTGWHDRKIHAKQLLTDKGEIAGSTNFTKKGLRENWETSAYVHFDPKDEASIQLREDSKKQFLDLYDNDAYKLSATDVAAYDNRFAPAVGKDWIIDQERNRSTKSILKDLEAYEIETGKMVEGFMKDADYKAKYDALFAKGYSEGDSAIMAAEQHFGVKEFRAMRENLPSNQELIKAEKRIADWKAKYGDRE